MRNNGTLFPHNQREGDDDEQIGIYARVSRNDGVQNVDNQLHELRSWAERLGGVVVQEYVDQVSGARSGDDRPGLGQAMQAGHERRFDTLLIWSLDRLSRAGIESTIILLRRLQQSGVVVQSLRESWLNTSDPHVAELLIAIMSWLAKSERERLIARTRAGMARAKRNGVQLGRPRVIDADQARRAVAKCGSVRRAAAELGCDPKTLRKRLA